MAQRKKPKIDSNDIDAAINGLMDVLEIDSLSKVDRFFALDLLNDYGKWAAIANAAWRSIEEDGLTARQSSGAKGNNHYKMVKSESIDIFKHASTCRSALATKISKFVKGSAEVIEDTEEDDGFDSD